ncbi:procathepsin L-like [Planococcus citri]|uniref:procathepsin L-like n=1 Tax=Planococcus citri TaxID=170843 RepID=UPI0031F98FE9
MAISILFLSILTTLCKFISAAEFNELDVQKWTDYKTQFDKQYETTELETQKMAVFLENSNKISQHNEKFKNGQVKFDMAMNLFGDMTAEEFKQTQTPHKKVHKDFSYCHNKFPNYEARIIKALPPNLGKAPQSKNWVTEGAVTDVKYQGKKCGSCWDFAAIGVIESHYFLHGPDKKLVSLSAQQVLDCLSSTQKYGTNNCIDGGCPASVLQYVIENGGIEADQSYMYSAKEGKCQYKPVEKKAVIKDYKITVAEDEKLIKEVVGLIGPVTCDFDVEDDFQFYSTGIFSSTLCKKTPPDMNHAMVIVGYGSENGMDYWLVKNQWTNGWGEEGYARIQRNTNECGIALGNLYPIV